MPLGVLKIYGLRRKKFKEGCWSCSAYRRAKCNLLNLNSYKLIRNKYLPRLFDLGKTMAETKAELSSGSRAHVYINELCMLLSTTRKEFLFQDTLYTGATGPRELTGGRG